MEKIIFTPIGLIHSPFIEKSDMPIQSAGATNITGTAEIYEEFVAGLQDLDGFSHIILLYHLHRVEGYSLTVKPFMDDNTHGLFSTRAPRRPNPIGLSVVRLHTIEGNILYLENLDMLDGSPLLDIKPFIPDVDCVKATDIGWLTSKSDKFTEARSDKRFS